MTPRHRQRLPQLRKLQEGYLDYLVHHRGLSTGTCRRQYRTLSEFLAYIADRNLSLQEMKVEDLDGFLQAVAGSGRSKSYLRVRGASLRGFLRYLFAEGWLREDISVFVEMPRIYRDASVPPHFTWAEVEQILAFVKGDSPMALRDRAMVVLLCSYGLRSGEIAHLTLDDLDWKYKVLRVKGRKGGSILTLPLVPVVEVALRQYLTMGRPTDIPYREILLTRLGLPFRRGGQTVYCRLRTLVVRAGLKGGRGPHALRRAVGTRLVEQCWGAGVVAEVLGHESPDTVRTYLRLSIESLRDVADNYGNLL